MQKSGFLLQNSIDEDHYELHVVDYFNCILWCIIYFHCLLSLVACLFMYDLLDEIMAVFTFLQTPKLICAFVFATRIVQFLYFLNPQFPASNQACLVTSESDTLR